MQKLRFKTLAAMAMFLDDEKYRDKAAINERNQEIQEQLAKLLSDLETKKKDAGNLEDIIDVLKLVSILHLELSNLKVTTSESPKAIEPQSRPTLSNPLQTSIVPIDADSEVPIQQLQLQQGRRENQLKVLSRQCRRLAKRSAACIAEKPGGAALVQSKMAATEQLAADVTEALKAQADRLEQLSRRQKWLEQLGEEEAWVSERVPSLTSKDYGKDFATTSRLIKKLQVMEAEVEPRIKRIDGLVEAGAPFLREDPVIAERASRLQAKARSLVGLCSQRAHFLSDALESHQYYMDADEAEAWMKDRQQLMERVSFGKDMGETRALCRRHDVLKEEVETFGDNDLQRLRELALLMTESADKHKVRKERGLGVEPETAGL